MIHGCSAIFQDRQLLLYEVSRRGESTRSKQDIPAKAPYFKHENEGMLESGIGTCRPAPDRRAANSRPAVGILLLP